MTILRWKFSMPVVVSPTDLLSLHKRTKLMIAEEIPPGRELDITPPFSDGRQILRTFVSKREGEGTVGVVTLDNSARKKVFVIDQADKTLEHIYGGSLVKRVDRERIFYVAGTKDKQRNIVVDSIIGYQQGNEHEGATRHRRRRPRR